MPQMEIREATVLEKRNSRLLVRLREPSGEDCSGCGTCPLGGLCHGSGDKYIDIEAEASSDVVVNQGDMVRIAWQTPSQAVSALVLFVPALAGLCFGGTAAGFLIGQGDGIFLAGTGAGICAGAGVTWVLRRLHIVQQPRAWLFDEDLES